MLLSEIVARGTLFLHFIEKAVAIKSYNGTPSPPTGRTALKFNKDDVIDVIGSGSDPSWTEVGNNVSGTCFILLTSVKKGSQM